MSQYTFREKENRPGIVYDETDKQRIFVEDILILQQYINELEARITALENA